MLIESFVETGSQFQIEFYFSESPALSYFRAEAVKVIRTTDGEYDVTIKWVVYSSSDAGLWKNASKVFPDKTIKIDLNQCTEMPYGDSLVYLKYEPHWRITFFALNHQSNIRPPKQL